MADPAPVEGVVVVVEGPVVVVVLVVVVLVVVALVVVALVVEVAGACPVPEEDVLEACACGALDTVVGAT